MKRLLFDVSRWHLMLHREHRQLARASERDGPQLRLEDERFERIYTGEGERLPSSRTNPVLRGWAERVHATCDQLPSFRAARRGDADLTDRLRAATDLVGVLARDHVIVAASGYYSFVEAGRWGR